MNKDKTIETLRGFVILLVVIGHVIGSTSDGGMKVSDDSFLRYVYYTFIDPVQMPLFTIIAGWVYSLKSLNLDSLKTFIVKKVFRLLVPMFVVGNCYFVIQYITPGTNHKEELADIWRLLFFPYTIYWYLYSLFFVFVITALIDVCGKLKGIFNWGVIFIISLISLLVRDVLIPEEVPNFLSFKGVLYLFPSFILGVGLNRFKDFFQINAIKYISVLLFIGCIIIQQLSWFKMIDIVVVKDNIFGLLIGFTGAMILLRCKTEINWMIWFGGFSYSIYLFHGFGTAAGRIIPEYMNVNSVVLIFITSLAMGTIIPIITEKILERFKLTRFLFLGKY